MSSPTKRGPFGAALNLFVLLFALLAAGQVPAAPAQPAAKKLPAWPNLPKWDGVWEKDGHQGFDPTIPIGVPQVPPYNTEYMAKYQERREAVRAGKPVADNGAACMPSGMPGLMTMTFPMELIVTPRQVTLIAEYLTEVRRIYTDGRGHPADAFPSTAGHSIGEWKNGELFVDTCCMKSSTNLSGGAPHSDAMHIKERWWNPDPDTLKVTISVDDPKAFTRPWVATKTYRRRPDWEPVEFICSENNRNPVGDDGVTKVILADESDRFGPPLAQVATAAPPPPLKSVIKARGPFGPEQMKRATAASLGNMAWEGVTIADATQDDGAWKWTAATPSGKWRCNARTDGSNTYCER